MEVSKKVKKYINLKNVKVLNRMKERERSRD